jgi:hypothetical protein
MVNETGVILSFSADSVSQFFNNAGTYLLTILLPSLKNFFVELFTRIYDLITAPYYQRDMLWMVVPLVATLTLLLFYFSRYKKEELGWNTAVGNSLVLVFVAIDLIRRVSGDNITDIHISEDTFIAAAILAEGMFLFFIDFFHWVPSKIAFYVSSPWHINVMAYFGVVIVYSSAIRLDWVTVLAILLIYIAVHLFFGFLKVVIPGYEDNRISEAFEASLMEVIKEEAKEELKEEKEKGII